MTQRNQFQNSEIERDTRRAGRVVLDEIKSSENLPATVSSEQAFAAVMCALEQALGSGGAQRLERGLPVSIRKLVARCEAHAQDEPERPFHQDELLRRVGEHLDMDTTQALELTRTVFHAVHRLMSVGEVEDVARELPEDLQALWRAGDDRGESIQSSRKD